MDYADIFDSENVSISTNQSIYMEHATSGEIALECLKFLICMIGTSVDFIMVYIIFKYKNMKKPINIYIMNWLISDSLFIFADPTEYRLYSVLRGSETSREAMCILFSCTLIIRTVNIMLMLLLLLQWFFERTKIEIFEKHCYKIAAGVWIFGLISLILRCTSCVHEILYADIGNLFLAFFMLFLLICLSIIHCMTRCSNPFTDGASVSIAMITSFILCWFCVDMAGILFRIVNHEIFTALLFLGEMFIYLYPLLLFYLFYKLDPMFAVCARILFRMTQPEEIIATFEELEEDKDFEESRPE